MQYSHRKEKKINYSFINDTINEKSNDKLKLN